MLRILKNSRNILSTILSFFSDFVRGLRTWGRDFNYPYRIVPSVEKGLWKIEKYNPSTNRHIYLLGGYRSKKEAQKILDLFIEGRNKGVDW